MSELTSTDRYAKAVQLAEAGRYQEALDMIEAYLDESPDDAEALNDAAVLLHCLERSDMAIEYLLRARQISDDPRILWNLVEAYLAQQMPEQASQFFEQMAKANILSTDALNRAAQLFIEEGRLQEAINLLAWSCRIDPRQEPLFLPMIEQIRMELARS